jgi:hypothetical protein
MRRAEHTGLTEWLWSCFPWRRAVPAAGVVLTTALVALSAPSGALAQTDTQAPKCAEGYYRGPEPGKLRYTKDDYLWVVTPAFAQRFCMPQKFVDKDLKGAEAVAFKIGTDGEVNCGFGGNAEHCMAPRSLRFEIFLDAGLKLPIENDLPFFSAQWPLSAGLVNPTPEVRKALSAKGNWRAGRKPRFAQSAFGLLGIKGDKVVWPIVTLHEQFFFQEILPGLDLVLVEGSTGHFNNPRARAGGTRDFVISLDKKDEKRPIKELRVPTGFAHIIYLPRWFSDAVDRADMTQGTNWAEEVQRMQRERGQTEGAKR